MSPNVTIVVPTFNRPRELRRLIEFLACAGNQYPVLVLDGGSDESKLANQEMARQHSFVTYYTYPSDLYLGSRYADGLERVSTPYCVLCGDDDFVVPAGIAVCADFLDEHPSYAAATGRTLALNYAKRGYFLKWGVSFEDVLKSRFNLSHKHFVQRFLNLIAYTSIGCPPLCYGTIRAPVVRAAFRLARPGMKYSSLELLLNSTVLLHGWARTLNCFFNVRDYTSEPHREAIRDDPDTYFARTDLEYIEQHWVEGLVQREGMDRGVAEYLARTLLLDYEPMNSAEPPIHATIIQRTLRRLRALSQALFTILAPRVVANAFAIPNSDLKALLSAQRRYVRLERKI